MRYPRLSVALLAFFALTLAVGACGDDALSEAEYFRRMDEIDKDLEFQGADILAGKDLSAAKGAEELVAVTDSGKEQYQEIDPPDSLKEAHDAVIEAIDELGDAIDAAANEAPNDAPFSELFESSEVSSADEALSNAYCALQEEADKRDIDADVGCN